MNDSMINWQGSGNININSPWKTEESSPAQKRAALEQIKDSLSTTETSKTGQINSNSYVSLPETPLLKAPQTNLTANNSATSSFGLENLFDIQGKGFNKVFAKFQGMAESLGSALKSETEGVSPLMGAIQSEIQGLSDQELKKLAPNATPEQTKALLSFGTAHMEGVTPELLATLEKLPPDVLKVLGSLSPEALKVLSSLPQSILQMLKDLPAGSLASGKGLPKELEAALKDLPSSVLESLKKLPKNVLASLASAPKEVLSALNSVSPEALSAIGALSPEVAAKAVSIVQKSEVSTGMKLNPDTSYLLTQAASQIQKGDFALAMEHSQLPQEQKNIMSLANEIPSLAQALPPEQKQMLEQLQNQAFQFSGADYGIPADWKSGSISQGALENAGISFGKDIEKFIENLLDEGKISQTEANQMRTDYFVYGGQGSAKDVVVEMQKSWGLPEGFALPVISDTYQRVLDGAAFLAFQDQLSLVSPALSGEEKQQLTVAFGSPEAANSLPKNLQQIFSDSKTHAVNGVIGQYGLQNIWQPQMESIAIAIVNMVSSEFKIQQAIINQLKEMLGLTTELNNEITAATGPTPTRISIANYMSSVSAALLGLQEQLYASAVTDAETSRRLSLVQSDMNTTKIKKQREDLDEILAKKKKMAALGPAFQWIIMIFYLIIMLPLFIAILSMMTARAVKGEKVSGKGPFDILAEGVNLPVQTIYIMYAILCPLLMAIIALVDLMFTGGKGLIEPFLKSCGVSTSVISKILMTMQMLTMVAMVAVMVLLAVTPGGQAIVAEMARSMGTMFSSMGSTLSAASATTAAAVGASLSAMGPIGQAAVAAASIIAEAVALAAQAGMAVMKIFASLVGVFLDKIYTAVTTVLKAVSDIAQAVGKALASLATNISQPVSTAASAIAQKIGLDAVKQTVMNTLTKLMENVQNFLTKVIHKMGLDNNPAIEAVKQQLQTAQNKLSGLEQAKQQLMSRRDQLQGFLDEAIKTGDNASAETFQRSINVIDQKIMQTNTKIVDAKKLVKAAEDAVLQAETKAAQDASNAVNQIEAILSSVTGTIQGGININNSVLNGQIALIKGALEAYKAETDVILKILAKVINNMLNQLQDTAKWIKNVTDLQQELMRKMSMVVSRLMNA